MTVHAGNITTQNLVPAGAATTGSAVVAQVESGASTAGIDIQGTYTGALTLQGQVANGAWVTLSNTAGVLTNASDGSAALTIASGATGIRRASVSGYTAVRVTALAAVTGTAQVSISVDASLAIGDALPAGTNNIGDVDVAS